LKAVDSPAIAVNYVPHFWFYSLFFLFFCGGTALMAFDHFELIRSKTHPLMEAAILIVAICCTFRLAYFCSFLLEWDGTVLVVSRIWGDSRRYTIDQLCVLDRDAIERMRYTGISNLWRDPSVVVRTLSGASIPLVSTGASWRRVRADEMAEALDAAIRARTRMVHTSLPHTPNG
jgi:hypothetical protein